MILNYFKIAFRNLLKNKIYSTINIIGLSIGIVCATLIFMWVNDELNFDDFHQNKEQIYKVLLQIEGHEEIMGVTPGLLAPAIKEELPEIKYSARVMENHRNPFKYKEKAFYEEKSFAVDPDFFKIFSFQISSGSSEKPYANPNDILLTESTAKKYFGDENPIGKNLSWNNWRNYHVNGIIRDFPTNSHLQIELFEPHTLIQKYWKGGYNWTNFVHETYILLEPNSVPQDVSDKIEKIFNQNIKSELRNYLVHLQPLSDIHLNVDVKNSTAITVDKTYITILSIIGFGILLIACFNFINISTANSVLRSKEVGVRKVLGSARLQLIGLFLIEFIMVALISTIIALFMLEFVLPYFNQFTTKELSLNFYFLLFFLLVLLTTTIFSGVYPAFHLSSFSPNAAFKNKIENKDSKISLRSFLVVFQFTASILLIISTIFVNQQLSYIQTKNLGFQKDNILYVPAKGDFAVKYESVKNRLQQNSNITNVAMQESVPTTTISGSWVRWDGQPDRDLVVRNTKVTFDYFETMNIQLESGRYFNPEFSTDMKSAFILNEAAVNYLNLQAPIGKEINTRGMKGNIIGVVKNSNFKSLHHPVQPLVFIGMDDYEDINLFGVVLIKFSGNDITEVLANVKNIWQEFNPNIPFEYHFLNQTIDRQYKFEKKLSSIFSFFSLLAILISCLGLFGLSTFMALRRTKEIGIRKVLGSSVGSIFILLTKKFIVWIIISNLIAWPIGWYAVNYWLQNYHYRIDISLLPFIYAGMTALLIVIFTISWQVLKAASANPVRSLRDE